MKASCWLILIALFSALAFAGDDMLRSQFGHPVMSRNRI